MKSLDLKGTFYYNVNFSIKSKNIDILGKNSYFFPFFSCITVININTSGNSHVFVFANAGNFV